MMIRDAVSDCCWTEASIDSNRTINLSGCVANSSAVGVKWLDNSLPVSAARSAGLDRSMTSVPDAAVNGYNLKVAETMTPRVPNDPVRRRGRS